MEIDVITLGLPIFYDVIVEGKRKEGGGKKSPRKEMGNRIARSNAVTSISILLGHYRQLHIVTFQIL